MSTKTSKFIKTTMLATAAAATALTLGSGMSAGATGDDADGLHVQYRTNTITFPDKLTVSGGVESAAAPIVLDSGNKSSPKVLVVGVLAGTDADAGYGPASPNTRAGG